MFLETRPLETFHYPALGSSNRVSPVLSVRARAPASGYLAPSPFPSMRSSRNTLWPFRASPYFPPSRNLSTGSIESYVFSTFFLSSTLQFSFYDAFTKIVKIIKIYIYIQTRKRGNFDKEKKVREEGREFFQRSTRIKFETVVTRKSWATVSYRDACKRRRGGWSKNWKGKREREREIFGLRKRKERRRAGFSPWRERRLEGRVNAK